MCRAFLDDVRLGPELVIDVKRLHLELAGAGRRSPSTFEFPDLETVDRELAAAAGGACTCGSADAANAAGAIDRNDRRFMSAIVSAALAGRQVLPTRTVS